MLSLSYAKEWVVKFLAQGVSKMAMTRIPDNMLPHTDDSRPCGYPPGVDHDTEVRVLIQCDGKMTLHGGKASEFGWSIKAIPRRGEPTKSAPITHYRIVKLRAP